MCTPAALLSLQTPGIGAGRLHVAPCTGRPAAARLCIAALPPAPDADSPSRKRLAVFVSGSGSNFKQIHAATLDGRINADVQVPAARAPFDRALPLGRPSVARVRRPEALAAEQVVVSDNPGCGGWRYAEQHGIATEAFPPAAGAGAGGAAAAEALRGALRGAHAVDYVLLAGFLKARPLRRRPGARQMGLAAGPCAPPRQQRRCAR